MTNLDFHYEMDAHPARLALEPILDSEFQKWTSLDIDQLGLLFDGQSFQSFLPEAVHDELSGDIYIHQDHLDILEKMQAKFFNSREELRKISELGMRQRAWFVEDGINAVLDAILSWNPPVDFSKLETKPNRVEWAKLGSDFRVSEDRVQQLGGLILSLQMKMAEIQPNESTVNVETPKSGGTSSPGMLATLDKNNFLS